MGGLTISGGTASGFIHACRVPLCSPECSGPSPKDENGAYRAPRDLLPQRPARANQSNACTE